VLRSGEAPRRGLGSLGTQRCLKRLGESAVCWWPLMSRDAAALRWTLRLRGDGAPVTAAEFQTRWHAGEFCSSGGGGDLALAPRFLKDVEARDATACDDGLGGRRALQCSGEEPRSLGSDRAPMVASGTRVVTAVWSGNLRRRAW
jgi:hypothetical protein